MSIQDKIVKIIAEKFDIDPVEIVPEASLIDDLGADSLDLVELVMTIEEEFDMEIPDDDTKNLVTVKDAVAYINDHL